MPSMSELLLGEIKKPEKLRPVKSSSMADLLTPTKVAPVVEEPIVSPKPEVPIIQEQALAGVTPEGLVRDEGIPVFSEGKMLEDLKRFGTEVGGVAVGAVETVLSLASGMLLYLPSKLAGVGSLPWGREAMELAEESIASLGYQPYTEVGKAAGEVVARGFEIFLTPARKAGEMITGLEPGRIAKELLKYPLAGIELSPEQMGYLVEFGVELGEFALTGIMGKRIKNQIRKNTKARAERSEYMSEIDKLKAEKALAELEAREDISEVTKARKEGVVKEEAEFVGPPKPEVVKPEPAEFVSKKTGKPFKTQAASNIRKNQLVEEGIETVAVKVDEGWVLKRREEVVEEPKLVKKFVEVPDKSLVDEAIPEGEPRVVKGKVEPRVEPGTRDPLNSAFFEDLETTQVHKKLYNDPERANSVKGDPDMLTMKLVNDVNRWYHGENLDISQIRKNLSELASRSQELIQHFEKRADFETFKSFISDAASWARKMKREGEGPSIDLRSGIDPGEVVRLIKSALPKWDKDSQSWKFEIKGMLQEIYKDPDSGMWLDAQRLTPGSATRDLFIGDTKAEAVKKTVELTLENINKLEQATGVKLTTGVDPADAYKVIKKMYDDLRKAKEIPLKKKIKEAGREAKRKGLDVSANIKVDLERAYGDAGVRIGEQLILQKGANARASAIYKQARKEVFGELSHNELKQLDDVIFSLRVIEIDRIHGEGVKKHPGGFGGDHHKAYLTQLANNNPRLFNKLLDKANIYLDLMKDQLKQLFEEGLLTEEDYNVLKEFDYSRRQLIDKIDPEVIKPGKRGISVRDSGIEDLAKGREVDALETDANLLMLEVISRTQGRIMKNRANKMLLDLAKADSTNPFVRIKTKESKVPRGWVRVELFDKGVKRSVWLSKDFAKEWVAADVEISYQLANTIRILSGSAILRPMATGIAPGFAFANLPRDIAHIWLTSQTFIDGKWQSTYSPFAPKFIGEMGIDLATVFSDAVFRKGRWDRYVEEGGGMEFLSQGQGKILKKRLGKATALDSIQDVLGYINVTSEILTRLALRERSIKKQGRAEGLTKKEANSIKGITTRATAVARDYMDFGQGGAYIKALDTGIPYTSAAVQGTRGIFRSAKRDPKTFAVKVTQLGTLVTGLYLANRFNNQEAYDSISDEIKKNNFVLTTPWKFKDEKNQTRYIYFTMPKDPSQKFLSYFFEYATKRMLGEEEDVDNLISTLTELSPIKDTSLLPPSVQAVVGYMVNKDFYFREDVWKGPRVESRKEFIPGQTGPAFIDVGQATGLSPERLEYSLSRIFTSGNMYSHLVGWGYKELFDDLPESESEQHIAMMLSQTPVSKRFIKVTNPYNKYRELIDDVGTDGSTKRWNNTREMDRLTDGYLFHKNVKRKEIDDFIDQVANRDGEDEADRIEKRFDFQEGVKDLDNRIFWLKLHRLVPEDRAKVWSEVWSKANEARRREFDDELDEMGKLADQIFSKAMDEELDMLEEEGE